jgi:hypothetical protein
MGGRVVGVDAGDNASRGPACNIPQAHFSQNQKVNLLYIEWVSINHWL